MSGSFPSPAFNIATIFSQPVATTDATNKAYVDATAGGSGGPFLPLTGGTVSGGAFLNGGGGRAGNWAESGTFTGGTYNSATIGGTWAGNPTFSGNITHQGASALNGTTTVGTNTAAASLISNGPAASSRIMQWSTASSSRWRWQANATAESGSNVGTDLDLFAFSDAGGSLGNVMRITRSNGQITVNPNNTFSQALLVKSPVQATSSWIQTGSLVLTSGTGLGPGGLSPAGFWQSINYSGTLDTGAAAPNLNYFNIVDTVNATVATQLTTIQSNHNFNTGASGDRLQLGLVFAKNAASADAADHAYLNMAAFMHYDAAESTTPGTFKGRVTVANLDGRIGSTNGVVRNIIIQENDVRVFATNTVGSKTNLALHWGVLDAVHGLDEDVALKIDASPSIGNGTGKGLTAISLGGMGADWPFDTSVIGTAILKVQPNNNSSGRGGNITLAWDPRVTYGMDLWGIKFGTAALRTLGLTIDGGGQIPVLGPGAITYSASGIKIAVPNNIAVSAAVASSTGPYIVGDVLWDTTTGSLWNVATLSGNNVATVTLNQAGYSAAANPAGVTALGGRGVSTTLNVTTAATGGLVLADTGQKLGFFGTAAVVKPTITGSKGANAALASLLTALANFGILTDSST